LSASISIIIRTKNEERWIGACLHAVYGQTFKNFEVILVDNESKDKTLEKAKKFGVDQIVSCQDYRPGKALNLGIRQARGDYIVCLSGHCIPVNEYWLENFLKTFDEPDIAGVYGRQEPMAFSADTDKRDLLLLFGLDPRVQVKDSFFHNANSMIPRELLEKFPFDETVTNIEDRLWAQLLQKHGYKILYEPEASVYHYHGVHQNENRQRCSNVVRILEKMHAEHFSKAIDVERLNTVAVIPVKGGLQYLGDKPLLSYTLDCALESKYLKKVIVSTDNEEVAQYAREYGAEVPFIRDASLSADYVDVAMVMQYSLAKLEDSGIYPDLLVSLEPTFPFRPPGLIDDIIVQLTQSGFDSIVAARKENRSIWKSREGEIVKVVDGLTPRKYLEPAFVELRGVACITHPQSLREGGFLGARNGIYEINNPYSHLEVRSEEDFEMAMPLMQQWFAKRRKIPRKAKTLVFVNDVSDVKSAHSVG